MSDKQFVIKELLPIQQFITASYTDRNNMTSFNRFKARPPDRERPTVRG